MNLKRWLDDRRLRRHQATPEEIQTLWGIVERDLRDASLEGLSLDRRYASAYNAILQLATIVLRVSGYRTHGEAHHWLTLQALPELLPSLEQARVDFFEICRQKRNIVDYDAAGTTSEAEAKDIHHEAVEFLDDVRKWLMSEHPEFGSRA